MLVQGQFRDIHNTLYTVKILSDNDSSTTKTIGENGLYFGAEPVVITGEAKDTFETLLTKSCEITLVTDNYIGGDLWAANSRIVQVNVLKGNDCIFAGFVEPNSYNQPFAKPLEEFTINCTDALSTLQYYNYKNALPDTYDTIRQNAATTSFKDMLEDMFTLLPTLDIDQTHDIRLLYDCSKGLTQGNERTVFSDLGIAEGYLLGEELDDVWTHEEVLEEILKYLNLHITQVGFDFYIFDWETLKNRRNTWWNVLDTQVETLTSPTNNILTSDMHGSDDTNITVDDVYNQIQVTCKLEDEDTIIVSPLEKDDLDSLFTGKQLYCREYQTYVEKKQHGLYACSNFRNMLLGMALEYNDKYDSTTTDWYLRAMINKNWLLHPNNGQGDSTDLYQQDANGRYYNQWDVAKQVNDNRLTPMIFQMGSVERNAKQADNEPIGKVSMSNYLYISVNGNKDDDPSTCEPTTLELENHAPMIEYLGGSAGSSYSPSDDDTTNYLVFSGDIQLQPIPELMLPVAYYRSTYATLINLANESVDPDNPNPMQTMMQMVTYSHTTSDKEVDDSDGDEKGRLYTQKFFTMQYPSQPIDEIMYMHGGNYSLNPPCKDVGTKELAYKYSAYEYHHRVDLVSKLPILECELIIGNKRLIETDIDQYGNSTFQWVTIGQEPTFVWEEDGNTYPITTFTLGVNPKLDDYIIGTQFHLQNTITVPMNLDTEGTAIPIKKSDALSGAVSFRILGPINTIYNEITRRHPTWFRHTRWSTNDKLILAHTQNIILKDFEAKIYTDNAGNEVLQAKDLIYLSDETDRYISKYDSTTFNFITQPTAEECIANQIKSSININAVVDMNVGVPINSIYNAITQETAKAEEHWVDAYYREYSVPRIIMEATMHTDDINWRDTYTSNVLNRNFFIEKEEHNLRMDTTEITLKEI